MHSHRTAQVSQTTSICRSTPGSGRERSLGLDRFARRAGRRPRRRSSRVVRPSPGSADLALDEERARPDAGRPESWRWSAAGAGAPARPRRAGSTHRRSAAGGRRGGRSRRRAWPARLCEQPLVAERRADRQQRSFEQAKARPPSNARSRPSGEASPWSARRCGGSAGELAARSGRLDLGSDDRPDDRSSGALPADGDRARRRCVPDRDLLTPSVRPTSRSVIRAPSRWACNGSADRSARPRPLASSGNLPSENARSRAAATTYVLYRGPQSWASEGSSSSDGSILPPARGARAARLSACCPAGRPTPPAAATPGSAAALSSPPTRRRNARICCRVSLVVLHRPSREPRGAAHHRPHAYTCARLDAAEGDDRCRRCRRCGGVLVLRRERVRGNTGRSSAAADGRGARGDAADGPVCDDEAAPAR